MRYSDEYYEDDLDNHHPTCRCGCVQLADECAGLRWQEFLRKNSMKTLDKSPKD